MIHSPLKKRTPVTPLADMEEKYDEALTTIRDVLHRNLLSISDPTILHELITKLKSDWRNYYLVAGSLIDKLIKIASLEQAQSIQDEKNEIRAEVRRVIDMANGVLKRLKEEELSNIDSCSEVSTYSTHKTARDIMGKNGVPLQKDAEPSVRPRISSQCKQSGEPTDELKNQFSNLNFGTSSTYTTQHPIFTRVVTLPISSTATFVSSAPVKCDEPYTNLYSSNSVYGAAGHTFVASAPAKCNDPYTSVYSTGSVYGAARFTPNYGSHRPIVTDAMPYSQPIRSFPYGGAPFMWGERLQPNQMDAASHHLIKQELFKQSSSPYDGDPQKFRSWVMLLQNRMRSVRLDPLDIISILMANTVGEPNRVITDYLAAGAASPDATLDRIWRFLHKEYGAPIKVCQSIMKKLEESPMIKPPHQNTKLKELIHLCYMIEANMPTNNELTIFNLSSGQKLIWSKLPDWLQRKWRSHGFKFGEQNMGDLPPFQGLVDFLQCNLDEMTAPNFDLPFQPKESKRTLTTHVTSPKKEIPTCLYHKKSGHSLLSCHSFKKLEYNDKKNFVYENKLCYKCLGHHFAKNCDSKPICGECHRNHITAMHYDRTWSGSPQQEEKNMCSIVCGDPRKAYNCSKTILCEIHHKSSPSEVFRLYAVIDDCSDSSYISEKVVNQMKLTGEKTRYLLSTMESLKTEHEALVVDGLWIRGVDKAKYFSLPELYTSKFIPGSIYEIGTPNIVKSVPHIKHLANRFLELDMNCEPLILLGRDCGDIMKCIYYGEHAPFVCETPLGYSLIGSPCPNDKTNRLPVKTALCSIHEHYEAKKVLSTNPSYSKIFEEKEDDDLPGQSREDQKFMDIVQNSIHENDTGHITISLPFKNEDVKLPDNRLPVYHRTLGTLSKLKNEPEKLRECLDAMEKNIARGHVERVPHEESEPSRPNRTWWLPIFVVTNPKKKKHRLVFDSSASYRGISLNQALLQGPDENNRLRGVLMRFRCGKVAFGGDIESMFYNFHLPKSDRDYLRFYWFEDNKPNNKIVQFRGCVHLFGNKPSPAIAHVGLQYTTQHPEAAQHTEAIGYIQNNIYVDDLLAACSSVEEAIRNLEDIRSIFKRFHIRFCKLISNKPEVMENFDETERALVEKIDIGSSTIHRALGLSWKIREDCLVIKADLPNKPLTRRGILSVTNSIFDPLGMVGPIVLSSKIIQRRALRRESGDSYEWDEPLPDNLTKAWLNWLESLSELSSIFLPRSYIPDSFSEIRSYELHTFSDASESAIGAVCYMKIVGDRDIHVAFIASASKLVPKSCTSIPRSELCAALLGATLSREVQRELNLKFDKCLMYSDSSVVLSYLVNQEKRFAKFVSHRVSCILKLTKYSQWQYVNTSFNPADIACRPHSPLALARSVWFNGPEFLWRRDSPVHLCPGVPDILPEVLEERSAAKTGQPSEGCLHSIATRVSSFSKAVNVVVVVIKFCLKLLQLVSKSPSRIFDSDSVKEKAKTLLILSAQQYSFDTLLRALRSDDGSECLKGHKQAPLDPYLDDEGVIRVGGRLKESFLSYNVKHPIFLPADSPLSTLITRHYHEATKHQGRHLTMGAVREAGFFIEKGSKLVRRILDSCVHCKRLRADPAEQFMASLPLARVENTVPFHHSGVDVFGPYLISENKSTRQTKGTKKIWCLMLTCMASRAIHVEPLQGLDITSLANALRRFMAIRGSCRHLYSDRGTNFVGISNLSESSNLESILSDELLTWHFNPPHAPHFGGAWERKIGALKRVFEGTMLQLKGRVLNRDEFTTLMLESMAIVNHTPMWEISSDPKDPMPLSPSMLLTLRDSNENTHFETYTTKDLVSYGAKRWRKVQFLAETFWQKWRCYFLGGLQERSKWTVKKRNFHVGDVVLIVNKTETRNSWPLAIVKEVKKSSDKLVRSLTVATSTGKTFIRPISEIILIVPATGGEEGFKRQD